MIGGTDETSSEVTDAMSPINSSRSLSKLVMRRSRRPAAVFEKVNSLP